jgi:hypothetical protein
MLILDVRVAIEPEHEDALNTWYHTHVPRLVSLPGYTSGRRYIALTSGPTYAALYEIEDRSHLPALLGADYTRREPLTLSEWEEWEERFVPHMVHGSTNLYDSHTGESPILLNDGPIVEYRFGATSMAAGASGHEELLAALRRRPETLRASHLTAADHEEVRWLGTRPANLVLVQVADETEALRLVHDEAVSASVQHAEDLEVVAYTQIARHWPFDRR